MGRIESCPTIMELFKIRSEVSPRTRVALAFLSWGLLVFIWFVITHWELAPPFSLPHPEGVVQAFARLWTDYNLLGNVFQSWWRIGQAFRWCAVIAIPLGLLMASFGCTISSIRSPRRCDPCPSPHSSPLSSPCSGWTRA